MSDARAVSGKSQEQWKEVYRTYYQALCFFAMKYLAGHAEAEDVVQNVFVRLLEDQQGGILFSGDLHLRHYLYKAVRNGCINVRNTSQLRGAVLEDLGQRRMESDTDGSLFRDIVRAEMYRHILRAVNQLPDKTGEVFRLAYFEQKSNPEIADLLAISVNTVKVHKNNAKKQLRAELKDLYPLLLWLMQGFFRNF